MRGRLGGVLLWQIFRTIAQRAQPDARVDAVVEFRITGRRHGAINRYQITLINGRARASRGTGRHHRCVGTHPLGSAEDMRQPVDRVTGITEIGLPAPTVG